MRRFLLRLLGHDEIVHRLNCNFEAFQEFIWANAKLADSQNIADKGYNSNEVARKWAQYSELVTQFYQTKR